MVRRFATLAVIAASLVACGQKAEGPDAPEKKAEKNEETKESPKLEKVEIGSIKILSRLGDYYFAGQPSKEDFGLLKEKGFKTIVNLRPMKEQGWDEGELVKGLGMRYENVPFGRDVPLTDEVFAQSRELLRNAEKPLMLHCKSSNRVGAIWYAARVLDQGVDEAAALAEAKAAGLRSQALIDRANAYVKAQRGK